MQGQMSMHRGRAVRSLKFQCRSGFWSLHPNQIDSLDVSNIARMPTEEGLDLAKLNWPMHCVYMLSQPPKTKGVEVDSLALGDQDLVQ